VLLEGIRILDLTYYIAGPVATQALADLGAETIKIEGPFASRRTQINEVPSDGGKGPQVVVAYSGFNFLNRNKKSAVLNLATPEGKELFRELVRISDVVVENYSLRVMRNFGFEYPALEELNPGIIMISMPGYGREGPYKEYASWGETIESTAGLTNMTGYVDGPPLRSAIYMPDPLSGMYAAMATIVCLNQRAKTGRGQHVTVSHLESATQLSGEAILDYAMNGRNQRRQGNRNEYHAPHGIYPCQGEDEWVAIDVGDDEQWRALIDAIGSPEWARLPQFADVHSRLANHDELDAHIAEWTRGRTKLEAMLQLQDVGVAAGAVLSSQDLVNDPHLGARNYFWQYAETLDDSPKVTFPGGRAKYESAPDEVIRRAPAFGEHNAYVLGGLLGLSEARIEELRRLEVTMDILPKL
jgi:crotonobetainyl-CoA:carnitine CoA-transferase CaiB-like acyl-CoA transferase